MLKVPLMSFIQEYCPIKWVVLHIKKIKPPEWMTLKVKY